MATTRRKSGVLTGYVSYNAGSDLDEFDLDDDLEIERELEAASDSEDSYSSKPTKKPRRKTKGGDSGVTKGKGRKTTIRILMQTMIEVLPLDVIFEIFGHLEPLDLLRLSRTNKQFRRLLTSRSAVSVWKSTRKNINGLPNCPPDQTEMQWAHLIFETNCTICDVRDRVRKVDWVLRLRACEWCLKDNLVFKKRAKSKFPHIEPDLLEEALEILPYSNTGGWAHGHKSNSQFFYYGAIQSMVEELDQYHLRIDAGVPGALDNLKAFQIEKRKEAEAILEHGYRAEKWATSSNVDKTTGNEQLIQSRRESIKGRLLALGHELQDITPNLYLSEIASELTDKSWNSMRRRWEGYTQERKITRLARERELLLQARRNRVDFLYKQYRADHNLMEDRLLPGYLDICKLGGFASAILTELSPEAETSRFDIPMTALPDLLQAWKKDIKLLLMSKLPQLLPVLEEGEVDPGFSALELATTWFRCTLGQGRYNAYATKPGAVSLEDLPLHKCVAMPGYYSNAEPTWSLDCLVFDSQVSSTMEVFITSVGLNPKSTTFADMDAANKRWACHSCSTKKPQVFSWRTAVKHVAVHQEINQWTLLNPDDAITIMDKEHTNIQDPIARFVCAICPQTSNPAPKRLSELAKHIQSAHSKKLDTQDYRSVPGIPPAPLNFVYPAPRATGPGLSESLQPGAHYKCAGCQNAGSGKANRLFLLGGVKQHAKVVHGIELHLFADKDYIDTQARKK